MIDEYIFHFHKYLLYTVISDFVLILLSAVIHTFTSYCTFHVLDLKNYFY